MKKVFAVLLVLTLTAAAILLASCQFGKDPEPTDHEHNFPEGKVVEANCRHQGYTEYTCTECGYYYRDTFTSADPDEHVYGDDIVTREPTCALEGEKTKICIYCKCKHTSPIKKLAHNFDEGEVIEEATCTHNGTLEKTCNDCGHVESEVIKKLEHDYDEGVVAVEATCISKGVIKYTCGGCGDVKTETTGMLEHSYPKDEEGNDIWTEIKSDTVCEHVSMKIRVCDGCGHLDDPRYEGHDTHEVEGTRVEATCTKAGHYTLECEVCHTHYISYIKPNPDNHTYDDNWYTLPEFDNVEIRDCTECGHKDFKYLK